MALGTNSQMGRVLAAIEEGPATSLDVNAITGLTVAHCSAYLGQLFRLGLLERRPGPRTLQGGRQPYLYSMKGGYPCK